MIKNTFYDGKGNIIAHKNGKKCLLHAPTLVCAIVKSKKIIYCGVKSAEQGLHAIRVFKHRGITAIFTGVFADIAHNMRVRMAQRITEYARAYGSVIPALVLARDMSHEMYMIIRSGARPLACELFITDASISDFIHVSNCGYFARTRLHAVGKNSQQINIALASLEKPCEFKRIMSVISTNVPVFVEYECE